MHSDTFDAWYVRVYPRLVAQLTHLTGSLSDAEDVCQEACLRAYTRWDRVSALDSPDAWVRRVAVNAALNQLRWRRRSRARQSRLLELTDTNPDLAAAAQMAQALSGLSITERRRMFLAYVVGLSTEELAREEGRSEQAMRVSLSRARAKAAAGFADVPRHRIPQALLLRRG